MDPELFRRATELFQEICDLPVEEQKSRLAKKCAGSEDLQQLVVELLENDVASRSRRSDETTPKDAQDAPEVPGFDVKSQIGEGGMGVVWRATQKATRREVALKVFSRQAVASWRREARFEREVELAAMLEHPGIARVYDSGINSEIPFYAMELVEGLELDDYLEQTKPDDRAVLRLFESLARAIEHAHMRGVIHRDLKPSNIMVRHDGQPVVVDFGLAKSFEREVETVSLDGQIVGTPAYMSPEQASGESKALDTRTDVYSLGVLLYRALSGKLPHPKTTSTLHMLRHIAETDALPLSSARPGIDPDLEILVSKALSRDRAQRYATAGELADDIGRWLSGDVIEARPPSTIYLLRKMASRHRVPLTFSLVLLVGLIVGTVAYVVSVRESRELAERWAYGYRLQLAGRALTDRHLLETRALLNEAPEYLRDWEWDYLRRQLDSDRPFGPQQPARGADYSADGSLLAIASGAYGSDPPWAGIFVVNATDGETVLHIPLERSPLCIAFSPDDKELWVGMRRQNLRRLDVTTGKLLGEEPYRLAVGIAMSPDGRWAAVANYDDGLHLHDLRDGTRRHVVQAIQAGSSAISFDAASERLLWSYDNWELLQGYAACVELETGAEIARWERKPRFRRSVISPDGKLAILTERSLYLWNFETGIKTELPHGTSRMCVALSPDGERLVTVSRRAMDLWRLTKAGVESVSPAGYRVDPLWTLLCSGSVTDVVHHPTRPEVYVLRKKPTRFDLSRNPQSLKIASRPQKELGEERPGIEPAPDNRRCALFGAAGVEVRDFRTAELAWSDARPDTAGRAVAWSQDGSLLASGWGTPHTNKARPSGTLVLHDAADGRVLREHAMQDRVLAVSVAQRRGFLVAFSGPLGGYDPDNPPSQVSAHSLSDLSPLWEEKVGGLVIRGPSLRFSPNEDLFVLEAEWTLRAWETESWQKLHTRDGPRELTVTAFDFHPSGDRLVMVLDHELLEVDTRSWKVLRRLGQLDERPPSIAYSPDGKRLAVAHGSGVALRDVETGRKLIYLTSGHTEAARFTPDGDWILTASNDENGFRAWPRFGDRPEAGK